MHDRRDDREGARHRGRHEGRNSPGDRECGHHEGEPRRDRHDHRGESPGGGPDTNFLQLEMSQVLYGEAEAVAKHAFRELLMEAAKERLRERFGDKIRGLAQLAVDELLNDVFSSLDIEARIREHNQERGRTGDRLRDILEERRSEGDECEPGAGEAGEGGHDDEP
jgi:hypothetical protein